MKRNFICPAQILIMMKNPVVATCAGAPVMRLTQSLTDEPEHLDKKSRKKDANKRGTLRKARFVIRCLIAGMIS